MASENSQGQSYVQGRGALELHVELHVEQRFGVQQGINQELGEES